MTKQLKWYSMTAVFFWRKNDGRLPRYEKRVTIYAAESREAAEAVFLDEAKAYAVSHIRFLKLYQIEEIDRPTRKKPVEVAHELVLAVNLDSGARISHSEFRRKFWGADRLDDCETLGFRHAWYNSGGNLSGCSNCRVKRKGRLWEK